MTTSKTQSGGLRWILLATVVAGGLGYFIQLLAPRLLDGKAYVAFSVVWSTIYLCVSAMSGVQQEVSRAARRSTGHEPNTTLRTFALTASAGILIISIALGFILGVAAVPIGALPLSAVLAIALVGYLFTTVLSGVLYGLHLWRQVALLTILDAALRALALAVAFVLQLPPIWLAFSIAFPFGLALTVVWLLSRRRVVGEFVLDVPLASLSRNVLSTVGAAACTGAMISGLPLMLGITATRDSPAELGALILAITLSRAPIVIPILALQSFLISAVFRDRARPNNRRLLTLLAAAVAAISVLSIASYMIGPALIQFISGGRYGIDPVVMAVIVMSAGVVGLMCVTGPALVVANRHNANVAGWAVAAALTVAFLLLPVPLSMRIEIALLVPPLIGLGIHLAVLIRPTTGTTDAPAHRGSGTPPLD